MAVQGSWIREPRLPLLDGHRHRRCLPKRAQLLALFEDYSSLRLVLCSELGPDDETSTDPVELREVLARWGLSFEKEAGSLGTEWTNLLQGIGWPRESSLESNLSTGLQGEIIRGTEVQIRNLN